MDRQDFARLETRRGDPAQTRIVAAAPPTPPAEGEAVLAVRRFALTVNNLTYAALGSAQGLHYWGYFPCADPDWGQMPVWGFADVVASAVAGVEPGERYYGYFPIASHVRMRPVRVGPRGFYDGSGHRLALVSAYNQYQRCATDAAYRPETEALQMLYRPLFITSFTLADYLADNDFFGARRIVVSSGSSKTAYGAAWCLAQEAGPERVALTSASNRGFVDGLGCYDRVLGYDRIADLDGEAATLHLDFSGRSALHDEIARAVGARLVHHCVVGFTQGVETLADRSLLAPGASFFFAPEQIRKRNADWGAAEMTRRFNAAQDAFYAHLAEASPAWVRIVEGRGFADAQSAIAQLSAGGGDPALGRIVALD